MAECDTAPSDSLDRRLRAGRPTLYLALVLLLAACGGGAEPDATSTAGGATGTGDGATPTTVGPVSVMDWTETEIRLEQPAERVACLLGACIDALAELGMKPVAVPGDSDRIAELPEYFGDDTEGIADIGGNFFEPNLEDIAAAEPDLVIGGACFHEGLREALQPIAPLFVLDIGTYTLAEDNLGDIGTLTGRAEEAESAVQTLEDRIAAYAERSPGDLAPLSLIPTPDAPLIDSTDSQAGSVLREVGPYPWPGFSGEFDCFGGGQITFSMEKVLEGDPDVIFVVRSPSDTNTIGDDLAKSPVWSTLTAVKDDRVHEVSSLLWSIGGTRSAGLTLDTAMPLLYPDVFPEPLD